MRTWWRDNKNDAIAVTNKINSLKLKVTSKGMKIVQAFVKVNSQILGINDYTTVEPTTTSSGQDAEPKPLENHDVEPPE